VTRNVQGGSLPLLALVQLPPLARRSGPSRCGLAPALRLVHVRPIKADKNEEKTMTIITSALLINALARLVAALARLVTAIRRRRR
jgi:hypothetical protein